MIRSKGFQKFARTLNSRVAYFVPHSFLFAILLTFTAYFLGVFITYQGPFDMVKLWVSGVWNLLSFSMQMVLMVAAGFSVASAPVSQNASFRGSDFPDAPEGGHVPDRTNLFLLFITLGIGDHCRGFPGPGDGEENSAG